MTFLFFVSLFIASPGSATPVEHSQAHVIAREDRDPSGFSPSIWIPIVIVILILSGLVLLSWSNRKLRRLILPGNAQNQSQPTTELTAEQLAGTINNGAATTNTNAPQPAARTRRARRPRRTPSQMSVTSLPAYNKEPGEQELVIFRANTSARLNSPSLISLNSISAPLTHTLTRTEIAYPKSGPTAEQIKIIASRESIARFGVPYGPDAVAFASTSLLDVSQPPPDFDSVIGPGSSSLSLNASMISLHARGDSSGSNRPMSPLAQPAVTSSDENEGTRDSHSRPSFSSNAAHPLSVPNSSEPNQASSSATAEPQQNQTLGSVTGHPSVASKVSTTYKSIAPSTTSVSEFGKLGAPPSSFNYDQTAISSRSESRASVLSRQSYATAAESIATRGHLSETDSEDDDAPVNQATSTHGSKTQMPPGLGTTSSRHTQEATDATVVGNSSVSGAASSNV
ncbi:hypothetical protein H1R20_g6448, partial [Candolleomyces eurysporus]